jgi:hypothetical protein
LLGRGERGRQPGVKPRWRMPILHPSDLAAHLGNVPAVAGFGMTMNFANSPDVIDNGSASGGRRNAPSTWDRQWPHWLRCRSTISGGVFFGAPIPYDETASVTMSGRTSA